MLNKEKLVEYGKAQEWNNKESKATWTMTMMMMTMMMMMMMMMMMVKTGKWDNIVFLLDLMF